MIINIANKYQLRMYLSRTEKRQGVCSKSFNDDNHILLWDFDNTAKSIIIRELKYIMKKYKLPSIYVLQSSTTGYHAYCFASRSFRETIQILADTNCIDFYYFKLGIIRGYYTLRFSKRQGQSPKLVKKILSNIPDEISPLDITTNEYYTTNKGVKNAKR